MICQNHSNVLIIINVENNLIFWWKLWYIFKDTMMKGIILNINISINVKLFTVTFDQILAE